MTHTNYPEDASLHILTEKGVYAEKALHRDREMSSVGYRDYKRVSVSFSQNYQRLVACRSEFVTAEAAGGHRIYALTLREHLSIQCLRYPAFGFRKKSVG